MCGGEDVVGEGSGAGRSSAGSPTAAFTTTSTSTARPAPFLFALIPRRQLPASVHTILVLAIIRALQPDRIFQPDPKHTANSRPATGPPVRFFPLPPVHHGPHGSRPHGPQQLGSRQHGPRPMQHERMSASLPLHLHPSTPVQPISSPILTHFPLVRLRMFPL